MLHSRRSSRSVSRSYSRYSRSISRSLSRSRESIDVENPGNTLYVTGLSSRTTEEKLAKYFSTEGKVMDVQLDFDPRTGESRGFGFVTMASVRDADYSIKYLDRSVLDGRVITVEKSKRSRGSTTIPGRYLGSRSGRGHRDSRSYSPSGRERSYSPSYRRRSYSRSPSRYDRRRSYSYGRSRYPNHHHHTTGAVFPDHHRHTTGAVIPDHHRHTTGAVIPGHPRHTILDTGAVIPAHHLHTTGIEGHALLRGDTGDLIRGRDLTQVRMTAYLLLTTTGGDTSVHLRDPPRTEKALGGVTLGVSR